MIIKRINDNLIIEWVYTDPYTDEFYLWLDTNYPDISLSWTDVNPSASIKASYAETYRLLNDVSAIRPVKIQLSRDGGLSFSEDIAVNVLSNENETITSSYVWNIQGPTAINCIIKIVDEIDESFSILSDFFSILECLFKKMYYYRNITIGS